jgi:hypothetical protein
LFALHLESGENENRRSPKMADAYKLGLDKSVNDKETGK